MRIIFGGNSDIGKAINGVHISREECDVEYYNNIFKTILKYKPDEIVNCAGVICPASIDKSQIWDWEQEIKINLLSAYYIAKIGTIYKAKIVYIGSTSGLSGRGNWSGYCASKAGLISLVQSMAEEGYSVWCVNPSRTDTKMRNNLFPNEDKSTLLKPSNIAYVVEKCFQGDYLSGSIITVLKNEKFGEVNEIRIEK